MVIDCTIARSANINKLKLSFLSVIFHPGVQWMIFFHKQDKNALGEICMVFSFFCVDFRDFGKSGGTLYFTNIPTLTRIKPQTMSSKKLYAMINLIVLCRCNKKCGLPTSFLRYGHTLVYLTTMYIPHTTNYIHQLTSLMLSCNVQFK